MPIGGAGDPLHKGASKARSPGSLLGLRGPIAEYRAAIRCVNQRQLAFGQPELDNADVHVNFGVAAGEKGHVEAAIAAYRAAINLKPDKAMAYWGLGELLFLKGDRDAAWDDLRRAQSLDPAGSCIHDSYRRVLYESTAHDD